MLMRSLRAIFCLLFILAPAALSAQAAHPPVTASAAAYRINPGDQLEIYVWGDERLQRKVTVLPDGTIAFPLVGQLVAQGYLPQELENAISGRLKSQYRGEVPQVTVSVVSPSGMQFSVLGKVHSPGSFTPGRYVNVLEALSMAGGPNEFANLDNVLIIRKVGDQVKTMHVALAPIFKGGGGAAAVARDNLVEIEPGDTIIVP